MFVAMLTLKHQYTALCDCYANSKGQLPDSNRPSGCAGPTISLLPIQSTCLLPGPV